ncbi:MAG TPA: hypothetical protein VML55_02720 [Planctomycetaceae bacterium]|nr:hypothetical protein [Planctomycetaceae bacterium]
MDYYILARKGGLACETVTFLAGQGFDERTAAVFTSRDRAQRFAAGWSETDEVCRLNEIDLAGWLIDLYRRGVQRVAVDPERDPARSGSRPTHSLCLLLADLAGSLNDRLRGATAAAPRGPDRIVLYRCAQCGTVRRQLAHQRSPVCCGAEMQRSPRLVRTHGEGKRG